MTWITPKIDWLKTDSINADDFNRIENNISEVANYLNSIKYTIPNITTVTNRDQTEIPFLSEINRIESNLETIRTHFITPAGYQGTKTWTLGKGFDFTDSNRLEFNVKQLMDLGVLAYQNFIYCGEFSAGETCLAYGGRTWTKYVGDSWQTLSGHNWLTM